MLCFALLCCHFLLPAVALSLTHSASQQNEISPPQRISPLVPVVNPQTATKPHNAAHRQPIYGTNVPLRKPQPLSLKFVPENANSPPRPSGPSTSKAQLQIPDKIRAPSRGAILKLQPPPPPNFPRKFIASAATIEKLPNQKSLLGRISTNPKRNQWKGILDLKLPPPPPRNWKPTIPSPGSPKWRQTIDVPARRNFVAKSWRREIAEGATGAPSLIPVSGGIVRPLTSIQKDNLMVLHNNLRNNSTAKHMDCIAWSETLYQSASQVALRCGANAAATDAVATSQNIGQFKKIYHLLSFDLERVVASWHELAATCPVGDIACLEPYYQLMWPTVTEFACAVAECQSSTMALAFHERDLISLVCHYNIPADFTQAPPPYQFGPPCTNCTCGLHLWPSLCCQPSVLQTMRSVEFTNEVGNRSGAQVGLSLGEQDYLLRMVNQIRDLHAKNVSANNMNCLRWSNSLAASAGAHADLCAFALSHHISRQGAGETFFMGNSSSSPLNEILLAWYHEGAECAEPGAHPHCIDDNYRQMVWARAKEFGCAIAYCPRVGGEPSRVDQVILVCHYNSQPPQARSAQLYETGPLCTTCACNDYNFTSLCCAAGFLASQRHISTELTTLPDWTNPVTPPASTATDVPNDGSRDSSSTPAGLLFSTTTAADISDSSSLSPISLTQPQTYASDAPSTPSLALFSSDETALSTADYLTTTIAPSSEAAVAATTVISAVETTKTIDQVHASSTSSTGISDASFSISFSPTAPSAETTPIVPATTAKTTSPEAMTTTVSATIATVSRTDATSWTPTRTTTTTALPEAISTTVSSAVAQTSPAESSPILLATTAAAKESPTSPTTAAPDQSPPVTTPLTEIASSPNGLALVSTTAAGPGMLNSRATTASDATRVPTRSVNPACDPESEGAYCVQMKAVGACDMFPGKMMKLCPARCFNCTETCIDTTRRFNCGGHILSYCFNLNIQDMCPRSCGLCQPAATVNVGPTGRCPQSEWAPVCRRLSAQACRFLPGTYYRLCPSTCGNCDGRACLDTNLPSINCAQLKARGECSNAHVREHCPLSCDVCPITLAQTIPRSSDPGCIDQQANCELMANFGYCKGDRAVRLACRRSCQLC